MAKINPKWILLCSAAIGAVYTTGYIITDPGAQAAVRTETVPYQNGQKTSLYKDGTYKGQGTNQYGMVEVSVTIKNHKITQVQITNCNTHYSESYLYHLPAQVIKYQGADVDVVSGATASTEDFQTAVQDALNQALGI